jgi:FkbH-like protein
MEPFLSHPDMILKAEDISVFMINWDNKVKNIQKIREILNIGFDSMVFLDDNPFERNIVRDKIPEIIVPELPEDAALYLDYLYTLNLFETNSIAEGDVNRTEQYQIEAKRVELRNYYENADDFLEQLEMESSIELPNQFNIPRIAQLTQRSNQFNLRTLRFSENEVKEYISQEGNYILSFYLKDKFGDHGLIAIVFLNIANEKCFIDNWLMSCRVLKRNMEEFTLNQLVEFTRKKGVEILEAEYIKSPKNALVINHYDNLGFVSNAAKYQLNLESYKHLNTFITLRSNG